MPKNVMRALNTARPARARCHSVHVRLLRPQRQPRRERTARNPERSGVSLGRCVTAKISDDGREGYIDAQESELGRERTELPTPSPDEGSNFPDSGSQAIELTTHGRWACFGGQQTETVSRT